MDMTADSAAAGPPSEAAEYYLGFGGTKISAGAKFLFWLGLVFLIAGWGRWETSFMAVCALFMFQAVKEFFNIRRGQSQPFIVLETDHFLAGRPATAVPYAAVERFVFAPGGTDQPNVAFSLFLRKGEMIYVGGNSKFSSDRLRYIGFDDMGNICGHRYADGVEHSPGNHYL